MGIGAVVGLIAACSEPGRSVFTQCRPATAFHVVADESRYSIPIALRPSGNFEPSAYVKYRGDTPPRQALICSKSRTNEFELQDRGIFLDPPDRLVPRSTGEDAAFWKIGALSIGRRIPASAPPPLDHYRPDGDWLIYGVPNRYQLTSRDPADPKIDAYCSRNNGFPGDHCELEIAVDKSVSIYLLLETSEIPREHWREMVRDVEKLTRTFKK